MNEALRLESERLARSWSRHDPTLLRDYLVADVEDPRINVQSLLTRHCLLFAATGASFQRLADQELQFAAALNWALPILQDAPDPDTRAALLYALRLGADNAEGISLPAHVRKTFAALPDGSGPLPVPNYLEALLNPDRPPAEVAPVPEPVLNTFIRLWSEALGPVEPTGLKVLEPACGSANDYRFLQASGIARLFDYTGLDLCPANINNARALFPDARFLLGNALEIDAPDVAFDLAFVHDLFEHLSPNALTVAIAELCRVTRRALCLGFFQMDEIPEPIIRPVDEYHWNTLSMERVREAFAAHGFHGQVFHLGTYLHHRFGDAQTHNPNAYTFLLERT